jgi:hypothetical protein
MPPGNPNIQHRIASSLAGGRTIEPCEREGCLLGPGGLASCGARACPLCGIGGVSLQQRFDLVAGMIEFECECGYKWVVREGPNEPKRG